MDKNKTSNPDETIDLRTLFRAFLSRKWWFIGTVILVLVAGLFYVFTTPVIYEAKYKFSLKDDYIHDDFLQYSDSQEKYINNESVFIGAEDVILLFKTDLVFQSLENIEEVEDYTDFIESSLVSINPEKEISTFSLKVKSNDKELSKKMALNLIESLGLQIENQDKKIFTNTMNMVNGDIKVLEDEIKIFQDEIIKIDEEINNLYADLNDPSRQLDYEINEKNAEKLLYEEKIIDREYEIKKLNDFYKVLEEEKNNIVNRIELITEKPSYSIENNRLINSIIVILLSMLTGIIVVLIVNYIYKLKQNKD